MSHIRLDNPDFVPKQRASGLFPVLVLWGLVFVAILVFLWAQGGFGVGSDYYLIPWSIIAGVAVLAPPAYIFRKSGFDLFHPLIFAVWSYIFPAFVLGGFILAFGLSNPFFLSFIENPEFNIPFSLFIVVFGYLSVVLGFYLPSNKYLVKRMDKVVPDLDWEPQNVWLPGIALMFIGIGFNILGFLQGVLGYQRIDETGIFDGLLFFLTLIYLIGNLLLWLAIFQSKQKTGAYYLVLFLLVIMVPLKMALQGNRGSLFSSVLPIAMAFWYSGRRLKWQHSVVFGGVLFLAISIGIVYGTTFRMIKGSEARINAGDYVGQITETIDYISRTDTGRLILESSTTLFERLENLSSLAVVVSNYEKLEAYEASYGLKNNIYNDLLTAFIPRFVWPDKPSTSDPRAYSDLYFSYGDNSFAITPFGDLLRNFGLFGIPLGMMIVGMYLRLIYSLMIETEEPRIWKKMAYYPLLTVVSYEAFYATMFPSLLRTGVVLVLCILLITFLTPVRDLALPLGRVRHVRS